MKYLRYIILLLYAIFSACSTNNGYISPEKRSSYLIKMQKKNITNNNKTINSAINRFLDQAESVFENSQHENILKNHGNVLIYMFISKNDFPNDQIEENIQSIWTEQSGKRKLTTDILPYNLNKFVDNPTDKAIKIAEETWLNELGKTQYLLIVTVNIKKLPNNYTHKYGVIDRRYNLSFRGRYYINNLQQNNNFVRELLPMGLEFNISSNANGDLIKFMSFD